MSEQEKYQTLLQFANMPWLDTADAENCLIGAICIEESTIPVISKHVEPRHFQNSVSRTVFEYAKECAAQGKSFDPMIAADALKDAIPDIRQYLAECIEVTPTATNAEEYAETLRERADEIELRSKVAAALDETSGMALTDAIAAICAEIIENRPGSRMRKFSEVIEKTYLALFEKPVNSVDTGYGRIDAMLKGLNGGELIIIAARPAVGKSAFVLSIAEYVAQTSGKVVQFYSLEMEGAEIGERLLARHTRKMSMEEIIRQNIMDDTYDPKTLADMCDDAANAYSEVYGLPIMLDDSTNVKPSKIRAQALTQKDLGLIVVDYGGLMLSENKEDSRNHELGSISRDLKNLAKELKVPIIMLAQLNRGVSETQKPSLRELRDSGELEQNTNKCLFLWNYSEAEKLVGVSVAKNRRGSKGVVIMKFDGEHMMFAETDIEYDPNYGRKTGRTGFADSFDDD